MSDFLLYNFPPISSAAWKQKIQFELGGSDYNQSLLTHTNEGITINPFYHIDGFEKIQAPTSNINFNTYYTVKVKDELASNSLAVNAINKGISRLKFIIQNEINIAALFVYLLEKNIAFHIDFRFLPESFIKEISTHLKNENVIYTLDIIGDFTKTGNWHKTYKTDFQTTNKLIENYANFNLSINVGIYQNAGANTIQQVAYALAHANEYLIRFNNINDIVFEFSNGSNFFFEIAKLRAFRYLFKLLLNEYKLNNPFFIATIPTKRNKTIYNSKLNLNKNSTECLSGYLGGADYVSNFASDSLFKKSHQSSENIAIDQLIDLKSQFLNSNSQNIVSEAYYIESLTKQIAEKALDIFKSIELSGGFFHQLKEGIIQRKIKESAVKEQEHFNRNITLNFEEKLNDEIEVNPFQKNKPRQTQIIPITAKRLAEKIEFKQLQNES